MAAEPPPAETLDPARALRRAGRRRARGPDRRFLRRAAAAVCLLLALCSLLAAAATLGAHAGLAYSGAPAGVEPPRHPLPPLIPVVFLIFLVVVGAVTRRRRGRSRGLSLFGRHLRRAPSSTPRA